VLHLRQFCQDERATVMSAAVVDEDGMPGARALVFARITCSTAALSNHTSLPLGLHSPPPPSPPVRSLLHPYQV
jgi:hypothetical protein